MAILKAGPEAQAGSSSERECKLLDRKLQVLTRCWICDSDLSYPVRMREAYERETFSESWIGKATWNLTGTPAGRNRSKLRTGIMKQSRSSVANEIGSLLELTKAPVAVPFC